MTGVPETEGPDRPTTGDHVVDEALADLDDRLEGGDDPVEAVVKAHRALQQRLSSPSEQVVPGRVRPGPPG